MHENPFWRTKTLEEMNEAEWESLCDGCGLCCMVRLEDEGTGEIHDTDIACTLFDAHECRCRNYPKRQSLVPDCVRLTPDNLRELTWLPETCAYRLVAEGRNLYDWHPLISGKVESVHEAGISVRGQVAGFEQDFTPEQMIDHIRPRKIREKFHKK